MPQAKLNRRAVTAIKPGAKPAIWYDTELKGFGLKIQPSGGRSWIIEYRPGAGGRSVTKKRLTIGSVETFSPEKARDEARRLLAEVRLGRDPSKERSDARADYSIADLCDRYVAEGCALKKPSTIATDRGRIERHIKPLIGKRRVNDLTGAEVDKMMRDIAAGRIKGEHLDKHGNPIALGGKGTATRTVRLLGGIFTWAVKQGMRPDNPVRGVEKFPDNSGERYLSTEELRRLGDTIREAETVGVPWKESTSKHTPKGDRRTVVDPHAAAAIKLLIFTGCRLGEILNLRWRDVDMERGLLFLPDSKTGRKTIVLSGPALSVLAGLTPVGQHVVAGEKLDKPRSDLKRPWTIIRRRAGIEDVRLHDLRHSFASVGAGSGMGLPIIGKLLGHANAATTQRYAHLDADPVRVATNAIGAKISDAMGGNADG